MKGKCSRKNCPYNHNFNVIVTDEKESSVTEQKEEADRPDEEDIQGNLAQSNLELQEEEDGEFEEDNFHGNFAAAIDDQATLSHA